MPGSPWCGNQGVGEVERGNGSCLASHYEVRALPGCAAGAEDTLGSNNVVVVTVTLMWVCHVLAIHALSSGIILHGI